MNVASAKWLFQLIGNNIKKYRKSAKISQAHLASQIGLSRTSLVSIEQGNQSPSLYLLWKIAEALEIELHALIPARSELIEIEIADLQKVTAKEVKRVTNEDGFRRLVDFVNAVKNKSDES